MTRALWEWSFGDSLVQFRSAVDRLFESMGGEGPWRTGWEETPFPLLAISEDSDQFLIEADLPGVRMDDLEITCLERSLTIRGERKNSGDPEESYERRERPTGSFVRTIDFPADVASTGIRASLEDGILKVMAPKSERAKPRRIEISSPPRSERPAEVKNIEKEK
jgi:HSP20 family protein